MLQKLKQWTFHWSHSKYAPNALFWIAFMEASFSPIPPDILLIGILLINAERWIFYSLITVAGSVAGVFLGYLIGWSFFETIGVRIVDFYHLEETMNLLGREFSNHAFLTVFTAAFTPIPFKIITIAAGVFQVSLWKVVIASIIGRSMRYFCVSYLTKVFGKRLGVFVYKYFNIFSIIAVIILIILLIAWRMF
ncbi:MAG: VTT domain-containing protein [Patescibacteria group bacterium]